MAEWNPITGKMGLKQAVILSILPIAVVALGTYTRFVLEWFWATMFLGLGIWGLAVLVAALYDAARFNRGKRPYLSHLVMSVSAILYGVFRAMQIDDQGLKNLSIISGIVVAFVFVALLLLSLLGLNTFQYNWKAASMALAIGLLMLLNGARLADRSNDASEFYIADTTIVTIFSIVLFFLFRYFLRREEEEEEFASARTTLVEQ